jgi:2-polyprenyl-6-methoxyphenol hydroxylase-like FAD-dependent oxidoreductase
MQFHQNGFRTGDPSILDAAPNAQSQNEKLPEVADVLIVGCGPAGLTLAAQLAQFPDIKTVITEQKSGPLQLGQADGVACRTMEMFEAFGFAEKVLKESYWVNETTFWKPNASNPSHIARSGRVPDVEEGLSHMPHVILNQARVHDFYLQEMKNSSTRLVPFYNRKLINLVRDADNVVTASYENGETIRAKYVVGCDGARSAVRQSIGLALKGDAANKAWGVMDVLVNTDFPDIRFKALIQSATEGSIVLIPREGGYMVRIYVEMDKLAENERVAGRNITIEQLIAAAQRIFAPYTLDVKEIAWWSVYEIGQRLCDRFDDVAPEQTDSRLPSIFIAGDACHTHSPKAGQGMNVSMQDAFNLGWKLAAVLQGRSPASLLHTYSRERQTIAKTLIDFDREWAHMLSTSKDPAEVQRYFVEHGRYTAGTATQYQPALLTGTGAHQSLATGFQVGTRFHSAPVIRIGDGKQIQLGACAQADGRWRLYAFAGEHAGTADLTTPDSPIGKLCHYLSTAPDSPLKRFTPSGADVDAVFDVRAVFQQSHHQLAITAMPELLFPSKGKHGLRDYEKVFCSTDKDGQNIYQMRGIDRKAGCLVVVRPDQYIAQVLPLGDLQTTTVQLEKFFSGFMVQA